MARSRFRRTSVLAALTAAGASVGIVVAASPASADIFSNIRQCESGGNYSTNTGNGYYGAYQFTQGTWNSLGYSGLPSDASPATQDAAAAQLAARSGFGQWPVCGAGGGSYTPAPSYTPSYSTQTYSNYAPASRDYSRTAIAPAPAPVVLGSFNLSDDAGRFRYDVALFQTTLNKKLHSKLKVDGNYGPMTALATLEFQKIHHLKLVDGVVGKETWKAVMAKPKPVAKKK
jgi:peptidoglycan hydrolase-like protein with peptidoglycan-binding domain